MLTLRPSRPRPPMPPGPPLTLSLSLAATLLLGGWFAAAVVWGLRIEPSGYLVTVRERLAAETAPVWPEIAAAFRRGNPPATTAVPTGDPRPTLAGMLARPYVNAAFHVAPDLTLTYRAKDGTALMADLRTWRPATFGWGAGIGPAVPAAAARHEAEATIWALVREQALARFAGPTGFRQLPPRDGRWLVARGTHKGGWIGYETSVVGDEGPEILARHGVGGLMKLSSELKDPGRYILYLRQSALYPPDGVLPRELDDLHLVPMGHGLFDYNLKIFVEMLGGLVLLLVSTGAALIMSLRQLRHLMRHQALAEARGRFVSGMSHEMRTPLTTIKLYAEMLQHGVIADAEARRGYLGTIARECDRLTRLVENVLAYAALEAKARPLVLDVLDAREAIAEAVAAARGPLDQAGLAVEVHAPVPLPVAADRDALVLAIANLLTNAAKYAADGRVVMLSALPAPDRADEALIAVRDFGPGVPDHERAAIFEPFYRRRHERAPGTGLGLALVHETAKRHGGRVEVAGDPGEGAEFRLRLPLVEAEA